MAKIIPHQFTDWSKVDISEVWWPQVDLSSDEYNFGLHKYKGSVWTSGYVGVGRLFDVNHNPVSTRGKEHVAVIKSRFQLDPWPMLEKVLLDDEYEDYVEELGKKGLYLFKVFYDEPLIQLHEGGLANSDLLYALSFINSCFSLCRKGLKKSMGYHQENYNSKVRGRIDVKQNIRVNTSRGRNDRFYCKFIDFSSDNLENRILKSTINKCKKILSGRFSECTEIRERIQFCLIAFRSVKDISIKASDFNNANANGLYTYYKPLLRQARSIYNLKYLSYTISFY